MEQTVVRTEEKYLLDVREAEALYGRLCLQLKGDSFNGTKPYLVRSLYFDTLDNCDYEEKLMGIENRRKIRLRVYDPHSETAKLEIKKKHGAAQKKSSVTVTREDAKALIAGNYDVLKAYDSETAQEIWGRMVSMHYRPVCMVEYFRRAFVVSTNDTRITFDSEVRSNEGNFGLFDDKLYTYPVMDINQTILEVKYNRFLLGYVQDMLHLSRGEAVSSSKYCMARKYGLHY